MNVSVSQSKPLNRADLTFIVNLVNAWAGIDAEAVKTEAVERYIGQRSKTLGFADTNDYMTHLRENTEEQQAMMRYLIRETFVALKYPLDIDTQAPLKQELRAIRENLHATLEELETAQEELKFSNHQSRSMTTELKASASEMLHLNHQLNATNARLRERETQLEQAHSDFCNFLASAKVVTIFLDCHLRVKSYTLLMQDLVDIDNADLGRPIDELTQELLQHGLAIEARQTLEEHCGRLKEIRTVDGRYVLRQVLPYKTESQVDGVVVSFTDMTASRSIAETLEEKNRRLEMAWEVARGGIFEHRIPLDETTYFSDQWARIIGYRREDLPHYKHFTSWLIDRIHPDDRERLKQTYDEFIGGRSEKYHVEARLRHRDNRWVSVRGISRALKRNTNGTVNHALGMMIDITDLKLAEESLRESERLFREMADGLPLMVWVHDSNGEQEYVNQTFCDFFGVTREEMKGGRWQLLVHPDDVDRYNAEFQACVRDKKPFHAETRVMRADGAWRRLESWARPRVLADGEFKGFVGASADVTARRALENQLVQADRQKDEFIAMLGHELRNPLASIRGASELLKHFCKQYPELEKTQLVLERQTNHMAKLLDGLLDVSRIILGKIKLETEKINFIVVCKQLVDCVEERVSSRGLKLTSSFPSRPIWIEGDQLRLSQVVDNLLSNAIKYTPDGGSIDLTLSRDGNMACLRITDTGVGIEADLLPYVFEPFRQSEQNIDRGEGGLGLGLALVDSLTELHGGTVEAKSPGRHAGSEFIVRLPLADAPARPDAKDKEKDDTRPTPRRILLIEDNQDAADVLRQVLEFNGHQVTLAMNGRRGIEIAKTMIPDIVLCDLGLPDGMNGFDVARALRGEGRTEAIPLIAISGYGRPEDKALGAEKGFDLHMTKPVEGAALEQAIQKLLKA